MGRIRDELIRDMNLRGLSKGTQRNYLRACKEFAAHFMTSPEKMGTEEVKTFLENLRQKRGLGPSSRGVYRAGLRFLYTVTLRRPGVVEAVPPPKVRINRPRILTPTEIEGLLELMPSLKHRAIFQTTYSAGLRISETCSLRVEDIQSERGVIYIRKGKGDKDRRCVMTHLRSYGELKNMRPSDAVLSRSSA